MFLGIIGTFFSAFSTIFRKKSIALNKILSNFGFQFLGWSTSILFITYFLFSGNDIFSILSFKTIAIIFFICVTLFASSAISQYVYKQEKISVLTPYENLNQIISTIVSFFLFSDVSVISLLIALLIIAIIFFSSFDYKTLKVPKVIQPFSFNQILKSIYTLLVGYLLLKMTSIQYYVVENSIGLFLLFSLIVYNKDILKIPRLSGTFYKNRLLASFLGSISDIVSFSVISKFGITLNIMLSFLYFGFILLLSYFILGDKPAKKSIIISITVTILVGIGFYFK